MAQENTVRAVERALQILNCYMSGKSSFTLVEIARMIELSSSTTLRIIGTLEKENYIYRDPETLRYYLGSQLAKLSHMAFSNLDVRRVARPHMEQLAEQFGEGAGIYIRQKALRVCVDRIEGVRSLRSVVEVGHSAPLTRGASGRVLLSFLPEKEQDQILEAESDFNRESLEETRQLGYVISYGEREPGVVSISAPIRNCAGEVIAALFLTGPETRMHQERVEEMLPAVVETAAAISQSMGWDGNPT